MVAVNAKLYEFDWLEQSLTNGTKVNSLIFLLPLPIDQNLLNFFVILGCRQSMSVVTKTCCQSDYISWISIEIAQ